MNVTDTQKARADLDRAVVSGRPDAIVRTIFLNAWPLFSAHYEALTAAISGLPRDVLEQIPALLLFHPTQRALSRVSLAGEPALSSAEMRAYSPEGEDFTVLMHLIDARRRGDQHAASAYADRLEERVLGVGAVWRQTTNGPLWFFLTLIGSTRLTEGDSARALRDLATARPLARLSPYPDAERVVLGHEALAHAVRGSVDVADRLLTEAQQRPALSAAHAETSATTEAIAAVLIALERMSDDLDDELVRLESHQEFATAWGLSLLASMRALLARHRPDEALDAVLLARDNHAGALSDFEREVLTSVSIDALAAIGDLTEATLIGNAHEEKSILTRLSCIRLALFDGDATAAKHLERGLRDDPALGPGPRAELSLLQAWREFTESGDVHAMTASRIGRLGANRNHRRLFTSVPRELIECATSRMSPETRTLVARTMAGISYLELTSRPRLTEGEMRVLRALASHSTIAAIATSLDVSRNTIKTQLQSLYRKLGCATRQDALQIATRMRLRGADLTPSTRDYADQAAPPRTPAGV